MASDPHKPRHLRPLSSTLGMALTNDIELTDESELYSVVAAVESLLQAGRGVRLTILTGEQWLDALEQHLSPAMRRGAERHRHVLIDRQDPHHLLVSPSAVAGINDGNRVIYAEVVYHVLRCIPTELSNPLRRGVDDLLAQGVGEGLRISLFTRNFPAEAELAASLLRVVVDQYGYQPLDWARLLRRDPDKFFHALEKSKFAGLWLARARQHEELGPLLPADKGSRRQALIAMLRSESLSSSSPLLKLTRDAALEFLAAQAAQAEEPVEKADEKAKGLATEKPEPVDATTEE